MDQNRSAPKRKRWKFPVFTHDSKLEAKVEVGRVELAHTPGSHVLSLEIRLGELEPHILRALENGLIQSVSLGYKHPEPDEALYDVFEPGGNPYGT